MKTRRDETVEGSRTDSVSLMLHQRGFEPHLRDIIMFDYALNLLKQCRPFPVWIHFFGSKIESEQSERELPELGIEKMNMFS